jgi:hypothetical protein
MTYFMAEYSFLPDPHMDIRKYIGMSSSSQNMKKSSMSREQKTPSTQVSSSNSQKKYSRVLSDIFQDISTARKPSSVASSTRGRLNPSTPR